MFWKDKKARQAIEQLRQTLGFHDTNWDITFEPFEDDELTHIKDIKNELTKRDTKLNLILDHLNLKYVPEPEKTEPAKLVEKPKVPWMNYSNLIAEMASYNYVTNDNKGVAVKPKRKYTKRKNSKK